MAIDYEIYPYAEKSRRLFVEFLELIFISLCSFLLFVLATSYVITNIPQYKQAEQNRVAARTELYDVGRESKLVLMYDKETALSSYDMFVRYSYKCIQRSFLLYEEDFKEAGFSKIIDPYGEHPISKENDELLFFYTDYAISKGLIETDNPLLNYQQNILDLQKHNNIMVFNEDLQCFVLNPQTPNGDSIINFAVALYREFYDDNKNTAMNAMHKFYTEYYDKANALLEKTADYKNAYAKYEKYSLQTSQFLSFGLVINYLLIALPYFLIMPLIKESGVTPIRLFAHTELTDKDGEHLPRYKRIIYYLSKTVISFFCIFVTLYVAYGKSLFFSPFGLIGGFAFSPIYLVAATAIIWLILGGLSLLPIFNQFKTTPIEYALGMRTADLRMDFEDRERDYKSRKRRKKEETE